MTSFAEFIINLMEKFGIFFVFSVIFIFVVTYVLSYNLLKKYGKDIFDEKKINIISSILAIMLALLVGSIYNIVSIIKYFLALVFLLTIILLFVFAILIFSSDKKITISEKNIGKIFVITITTLIAFMFISYYFAYEKEILSILAGEPSVEPSEAAGGIVAQRNIVISYIFRAELLIIPFIFVILGLLLIAWGTAVE